MQNTRAHLKMTLAIKNTLLTRQALVTSILLALVFIFGMLVVVEKDTYRQMFMQSVKLQDQQIKLKTQWSQLILEESTWGSLPRVERIATHELNMHVPQAKEIRVIDIR